MTRWRVGICPQHGLVESGRSIACWCGMRFSGETFRVVREPTPEALDGAGQARSTDPETAKAAGAIKVTRGSQRWKVLEAIREAGLHGATSHELEDATGVRYASLTPRIGELKRGGYIRATDKTRVGKYGVEQEVLVLAGSTVAMLDSDDDDALWENPDVLFVD